MLSLRYCTLLCKSAEYKNMDQDLRLGQLYNVQSKIKILYKAKGWAYFYPTTLWPMAVPLPVPVLVACGVWPVYFWLKLASLNNNGWINLRIKGISLHFISLHCIPLHYIALHCILWHFISLHCISLHSIANHCISLHSIALHYIAFHCILWHSIAFHFIAV